MFLRKLVIHVHTDKCALTLFWSLLIKLICSTADILVFRMIKE